MPLISEPQFYVIVVLCRVRQNPCILLNKKGSKIHLNNVFKYLLGIIHKLLQQSILLRRVGLNMQILNA